MTVTSLNRNSEECLNCGIPYGSMICNSCKTLVLVAYLPLPREILVFGFRVDIASITQF